MMNLEKEELVKRVGKNIREFRLSQNLSLEKLALQLDMEYSQLSRIERGLINTSVYHLYKIYSILNIPIKNIFEK